MENGKKKPSIVFCHGIWADGSCWSKLIPTLQEEGYEVIACQYTLQTVAEDVLFNLSLRIKFVDLWSQMGVLVCRV